MEFFYHGGTPQERELIRQSLALLRFPLRGNDRISIPVHFYWSDDPDPNSSNEYMSTTFPNDGQDGIAHVTIQNDANNPGSADNGNLTPDEVQRFYMESIAHEMGHVFFGFYLGNPTNIEQLARMYRRKGGTRRGTLDDWSPMDRDHDDRIVEANVEFFKDVYFPRAYKVFDQRTNWTMTRESFNDWFDLIEAVICPDDIIVS